MRQDLSKTFEGPGMAFSKELQINVHDRNLEIYPGGRDMYQLTLRDSNLQHNKCDSTDCEIVIG